MKKIIYSAMMLAMLASCSKNENVGAPEINGVPEIKLSGKALSIETKGAYTGTTPTTAAPLKAFVVGSLTNGSYISQKVSGTMTFTGLAAGFDPGSLGDKQYPVGQASVYLMGFYPTETKAGGKWSASANKAVLDFAGTEDVMFAQQIATTSADVATGATPKNFSFEHQLTMLEVKVVVDGDQTIADNWGILKDMKLVGSFPNKATVTMAATGAISFSNPVTDWNLYTDTEAVFAAQAFQLPLSGQATGAPNADLLAAAKFAASTLVAPHTAVTTTPSYKLAITTGLPGDPTSDVRTNVDVKLKTDLTGATDFAGNTKGYKFSVLLVFKSKTIHATATVEAWKDGGTTIEPIE